jgi:hypothetical protein
LENRNGETPLLGAAGGLVATALLLVLFTPSVSTAGAASLPNLKLEITPPRLVV